MFLIPIYFIEMNMGNTIKLGKPFYLTLTYVVLFPGLAAFFFWIKGIALIGANRAGAFLHLMPIFGAVMAMIIFKEKFKQTVKDKMRLNLITIFAFLSVTS